MADATDHIPLQMQPQDEDGPVFTEPWQAQAFAIAVQLSESGLFTWKEWTETVGEEIRKAQGAGDPDLGDTYYEHWLQALERLACKKGVTDAAEMSERKEAWRRAYLNTTHGKPVELAPPAGGHDFQT